MLRDARDDCSGKILSSFDRDFGKLEMLLALDIYLTYGVTNNKIILCGHKEMFRTTGRNGQQLYTETRFIN